MKKKELKQLQKKYAAPKDASPDELKRLRRNLTAAIWRANNREKVRQSSKIYREKAKEKKQELETQLEQGQRPSTTVTPLTDGPQLMYDALSYGSKVTGAINAAWIEAEASGRKVVGLIKDFEGGILGPYFTLTGFTAAIQQVYQEGLALQEKTRLAVSTKTQKGPAFGKYPMVSGAFSDDGATVYITVECSMV